MLTGPPESKIKITSFAVVISTILLLASVTSIPFCTGDALTDSADYEWYDEQSNPYVIKTAADLKGLANIVNGDDDRMVYDFTECTIELETDIDLKGYCWLPIGLAKYSYDIDDVIEGDPVFSGTFDGKGHVISNMTVNTSNTDLEDYSTGLFGTIDRGEIKNLTLLNCKVTGRSDLGMLAGIARNTNVSNVYVTDGSVNSIGSSSFCVGGIIGWFYCKGIQSEYQSCNLEYCSNSSDITVDSSSISMYTGGITGALESLLLPVALSMCYNTGNITVRSAVSSSLIGGISGWEIANTEGNATIAWCYNTGRISVDSPVPSDIGGIVGSSVCNKDGALIFIDSYNIGDIYAKGEKIGGIIGSINLDNAQVSIIDFNYYNTDTCSVDTAVGKGLKFTENTYGLKNWEMTGSNAVYHMIFNENTDRISFNGGVCYPGLVSVSPDGSTYYPNVIDVNENAENIATIISILIVTTIVTIVIGKSRQ